MASYLDPQSKDYRYEVQKDDDTVDVFRQVEKQIRKFGVQPPQPRRRRRGDVPSNSQSYDLADVFDLRFLERNTFLNKSRVVAVSSPSDSRIESQTQSGHYISPDARVFRIEGLPDGFYIITNALSAAAQLHWARQALEVFSASEHTNLTNLENERAGEPSDAPSSSASLECQNLHPEMSQDSNIAYSNCKKVGGNVAESLWRNCLELYQRKQESEKEENPTKSSTPPIINPISYRKARKEERQQENENIRLIFKDFNKLRWASLGYHYNWTLRQYLPDLRAPIPAEFARLCKQVAEMVGCKLQAEAAIVNFYPLSKSDAYLISWPNE
jgi:hypothetical protein